MRSGAAMWSTSSTLRGRPAPTTSGSPQKSRERVWPFSTPSARTCTPLCSGRVANEPDLALPLAVELRHYWLIRGYQRQGLELAR